MPRRVPPPLSVTLTWLREAAAWSQKELAGAAHVHPNHLSDYEKGLRPLSRKRLEQLVHIMGYDDSAIDLAVLAVKAISLPKESDDEGEKKRAFDRLSAAEKRLSKQGATRLGLVVTDLAEARFLEMARARRVAAARERAGQLWERLAKLGIAERRSLIERSRIFRLWAVSERLAEESAKAAPRDAESALELARVAVRAAELTASDGELGSRRLQGFARAFLANAMRVDGKVRTSETEVGRARIDWQAGEESDPARVLPEWRLLDLEASLRRDKRQFGQALELLDRARSLAPREMLGRILLKRATTLEHAGDLTGAVETLLAAAPLVEESGDLRLKWALRFNRALWLCHLGCFDQAASELPLLSKMSQDMGNELDLVRTLWLSGRVAEGQGRHGEARAAFEQVRNEFAARRNAVETAMVSLELALLSLREGRTVEVRRLAEGMMWIFGTEGIAREPLAALRLFCEAATQETATIEQAQQLLATLKCGGPKRVGGDFDADEPSEPR